MIISKGTKNDPLDEVNKLKSTSLLIIALTYVFLAVVLACRHASPSMLMVYNETLKVLK